MIPSVKILIARTPIVRGDERTFSLMGLNRTSTR